MKGNAVPPSSCPTALHTCLHAQVGQHYLADGWGQQLMTLSDFIARHIRGEQQREQGQQERQGQTGQEQGGRVGYLAQHPLFDQVGQMAYPHLLSCPQGLLLVRCSTLPLKNHQ